MNIFLLLASGGGMTCHVRPGIAACESIHDLSILVAAITGLIFLIVEGCSVTASSASGGAHRRAPSRRRSMGASRSRLRGRQRPALIVFILVLVTTRTLWEVKANPPEPQAGDHALFITVVGRQWWWNTRMNRTRARSSASPQQTSCISRSAKGTARPVYLTLKSADVCHSFWVPKLGGKTDFDPRASQLHVVSDRADGPVLGQCAEYCGSQHANMLIRVVAEPAADFEQWLEHEKEGPRTLLNRTREKRFSSLNRVSTVIASMAQPLRERSGRT